MDSIITGRPRRIPGSARRLGGSSGTSPARSRRGLREQEQGRRQRERRQADPGPHRPARRAAFRERHQEQDHRRAQERGTERVERGRLRGVRLRDRPEQHDHGDRHDRHVDEEHRAPARARDVRADHQPAEDLPERERKAHNGTEHAHGPRPPGPGRGRLDGRHRLRQAQRGRRALQDAGRHERPARRGEPAQQRGDAEPDEAQHHHAPAAEAVAEPAAEHQQRRVRRRVPGDDEFERRRAGFEVGADRRQRHIHDEGIHRGQ
jgi:hypothetical protein